MVRNARIIIIAILLCCGLWGYYSNGTDKSPIAVEWKTSAADSCDYLIIYQKDTKIDFETKRPNTSDTSIFLCIPGAFTSLDKFDIDGLYICKGKIGNKDKINRTLGGGIKIINGNCTIFHTGYGKLLTDSLVDFIANHKGSFFQQVWMIDNGKIAAIDEKELTYRRGIAIFKNGKTAVIESQNPVTLETFAKDLFTMGVMNLIYTDMGAWDEGWYRSPRTGKIVPMGTSHTQTARQSNWVVFRR